MSAFFRSRIWMVPVILFIINLGLKIIYIASNPVALDEPFTIFYAQPAFLPMLKIHLADNTPPLFDVLLFGWIRFFGISAFSVRFLPMVFSSATVIYVYLLGERIAGKISGLASALIFSFSTFQIYFAHEARAYSLFSLLSAASLYYYFSLDEKSTRRPFILFIVSNVLLAFTHYFGFIVVGAELAFSFWFIPRHPFAFRKIWLSFITWLALISPLIVFVLRRYHTVRKTGFWVSTPPLDAWYENIRKFSNQPVIAIGFLLLIGIGLVQMFRKSMFRKNLSLQILPLWFFGIYTALFVFSFHLPVFLDRYLIFLSVPFYLLIGVSIPAVTSQYRFQVLLLIVIGIAMIATTNLRPGNGRDPIKLSAFVMNKKDSSAAVLISPPWLDKGLIYYCRPDIFRREASFDKELESDRWYRIFSSQDAVGRLTNDIHRVLYVLNGADEINHLGDFLEQKPFGFKRLETRLFGNADGVVVYER